MDVEEQLSLVALSFIATSVHRFPSASVFQRFPTARALFGTPDRDLLGSVEGLSSTAIERILAPYDRKLLQQQLQQMEALGVRMVPYYAEDYPENLKHVYDAPPVLFIRGVIEKPDVRALAIIGSRKATPYGVEVCQKFTSELVQRGFLIVSGMARGIDAIAHWSALESGGRTVAVLGTGVDIIYPSGNSTLYGRIIEHGSVLSEFPLGTRPYAAHFPRRNRIISGLCVGVLVVEAAERSGTMTTVRMALEQGREVFAVPGDIRSDRSRGTHHLIKQGAKLVDRVEDIMDEVCGLYSADCEGERAVSDHIGGDTCTTRVSSVEQRRAAPQHRLCQEKTSTLSKEAISVLDVIGCDGTLLDVIVARSGLPAAKVAGILTELEILGKVRSAAGSRYQRLE